MYHSEQEGRRGRDRCSCRDQLLLLVLERCESSAAVLCASVQVEKSRKPFIGSAAEGTEHALGQLGTDPGRGVAQRRVLTGRKRRHTMPALRRCKRSKRSGFRVCATFVNSLCLMR